MMPFCKRSPFSHLVFYSLLSIFVLGFNTVVQAQNTLPQDNKIRIRDSHGKWAFDKPPTRIAVINWTLTEQLIELNVNPVAIADIPGFKTTSPQTPFSKQQNNAIDLGSRFTPNLKKLKDSEPELILIGYSQRDLLRPLSNIAPVMYFNNFSRRNNNAEKADERFLILAKLFNKTEFAKNKLRDRDEQIIALRQRLERDFRLEQFANEKPLFTVASLKQNELWAFSNNSLPEAIVKKLVFSPELIDKPSKLGTRRLNQTEIDQLNGCLILINNSDNSLSPSQSSILANSCTFLAKPTNTFGGAMSQLYLAKSLVKSLTE